MGWNKGGCGFIGCGCGAKAEGGFGAQKHKMAWDNGLSEKAPVTRCILKQGQLTVADHINRGRKTRSKEMRVYCVLLPE